MRKTAWEILIERTDARYVAFQVDAFWASDAFDDATGTATAAFINKYPTRIKLMHVKDGTNVAGAARARPTAVAAPRRAFGTGEVDYRPILAAGNGKVQYYRQEQDGATLNDIVISLRNLKGRGRDAVPAVLAPADHVPGVAAGTAAAANVVPITIKNTGDAPLTITNIALASNNTTGSQIPGPRGRAPRRLPGPRRRRLHRRRHRAERDLLRQRRLQADEHQHQVGRPPVVISNADDATESILLNGTEHGRRVRWRRRQRPRHAEPLAGRAAAASARSCRPPRAPTTRPVPPPSSAPPVTRRCRSRDPSAAATGRLVNGTFALTQPLQVGATNAATTTAAYAPLSTTAGTPVNLLTYNGPTAGADAVTRRLPPGDRRQRGPAHRPYNKTLTFTLSTTQP